MLPKFSYMHKVFWLHVENIAASDLLQFDVNSHWLTQKHGSFRLVEIQTDFSLADTIIWQLLIG